MMYFQKFACLILTAAICFVTAQDYVGTSSSLICYECDPNNFAEQCVNPVGSGVQQITCDSGVEANSSVICFSANITYSGAEANSSGIHRGCQVQSQAVTNFCDWFREEINNRSAVLSACDACNTTRCNSVVLASNGDGRPSSAISLLRIAFTTFIVSVLSSFLF